MTIFEVVSKITGIPSDSIPYDGVHQTSDIVWARQLSIVYMRDQQRRTWREIATFVGYGKKVGRADCNGRSKHTSAMDAYNSGLSRIQTEGFRRSQYEALKSLCPD